MRRFAAVLALCGLAVAACGGDEPADETGTVIEVFTNYRGANATAFRRVLDGFEASSGHRVNHVGTADFADRIQERVAERDAPDIALFPQPGLIRALATEGQIRSFQSISETTADEIRSNYPAVLDPLTVDGELYALPWRVDVGSLIWYQPAVFERLGYEVPESFVDLVALASQMRLDGQTPWCLTIESFEATGWVGTDWIEDIVLRTQPVEVYDDWATGAITFDDERVRDAFTTWREMALDPGMHFGTTRTILNTPWSEAGDPMFDDEPGCLMHRQLGGAYRGELPPETTIGADGDVAVFVMPGAEADGPDPVLLAGEFAAAMSAEPGVEELLLYLADPLAGETWAETGGYLSPHLDFDRTAYSDDFARSLADVISEAELLRFDGSDTMPPTVGVGTFWTGVVDFVGTQDLDRAVTVIDAGFDDGD